MGAEWKVTWSVDEDFRQSDLDDMDALPSHDLDDYMVLQVMVERWDDERVDFQDYECLGGILYDWDTELFVGEAYRLDDPRFEAYQAEVVRDLADEMSRRG